MASKVIFSLDGISAWAPGIETDKDWGEWAKGNKEILRSNATPPLKHLAPNAKRRLSQLTKMVLEVGHTLSLDKKERPIIFSSEYGEINVQNKISRSLIESGEIRPAQFSLSVFNTPLSLLSIHEKNRAEQTVLLSGKYGVFNSILSLISDLENIAKNEALLIFADELLPEDYSVFENEGDIPYAFGCKISSHSTSNESVQINCEIAPKTSSENNIAIHPLSLLKWLLSNEKRITYAQDDMCCILTKCASMI